MFTGIIEVVGQIEAAEELSGGRLFRLSCSFADELRPDQSVAVNGVCLTVVKAEGGAFEAVAVEETLSKTTLGALRKGDPVNLERAMRPGDRLDGHIVQGHVDATSEILAVQELHDSRLISVSLEPRFSSYIIPVGSIAIDGVSLTVARLGERDFSVAIIPHTLELTNVSSWTPGTRVNIEFDLLGKYVARWMEARGE
jgi:riboflavin synthase